MSAGFSGKFILLGALAACCFGRTQGAQSLWSFEAGQPIRGSPAIGLDGTLYVSTVGSLIAITNAGSNKWTVSFEAGANNACSSPAIGRDGTIYVVGRKLLAVGPDKTVKWDVDIEGGNGSPALGYDHTVYIAGKGLLWAISQEGATRWKVSVGGTYSFGTPTVGVDNMVFMPAPEIGVLFGIDPFGAQVWTYGFPELAAPSECAIQEEGRIYCGGGLGRLYQLAPTGATLWSIQLAQGPSAPALGEDGTVYAATSSTGPMVGYGFGIYAVTAQGGVKWHFATNAIGLPEPVRTPAIDEKGTIYYSSYGSFYAFGSDGQIQWSFDIPGGDPISYTSPAIGPDGTVYCTFGSTLYAFAGTNALARSPWPMYRGNAQHTGRIQKPSLQNPKKRADANLEFQLFSQTGTSVSVESSTNLTTWATLTNLVPAMVPEPIIDLTASNSPAKFYRAKGGG